MPTIDVILLHPGDNVCVAARNLEAGVEIVAGAGSPGETRVTLREPIRMGHKIALRSISANAPVLKYGFQIGFTSQQVEPGEWVHTHNVTAGQFERDYAFCSDVPAPPTPITDCTFQGYRRANGKAATRNYLGLISSVNCSATVCKQIARRVEQTLLDKYPNIDGIVPMTHPGGCGMATGGDYHNILSRTLGGMAKHPNLAGYILIGLGCETNTLGSIISSNDLVQIGETRPAPPPVLSMQDCGGTQRTIEAGVRIIAEMLPKANDVQRVSIPASEIILGTECGGSDGASGITANPAVGVASDLLVACGATTILAEVTELYGAEPMFTRRATKPEVAEKLLERIRWWEEYAEKFNGTIDNNPSPGNKEGGLTTIYEKSLGAAMKGGTTALQAVYEYAEQVTRKGFVIMDTPGFDPPSVTGMVAGGANVVVFTTGRGSCFGFKPTPSIKIATNTPMYERMVADMDINAGVVLSGTPIAEVGRQIFEEILEVASGKQTKSEAQGIGEDEFAPWMPGGVF